MIFKAKTQDFGRGRAKGAFGAFYSRLGRGNPNAHGQNAVIDAPNAPFFENGGLEGDP